jgi:hypothetical protein
MRVSLFLFSALEATGTAGAARLAERRKLADHKSDEYQAAII